MNAYLAHITTVATTPVFKNELPITEITTTDLMIRLDAIFTVITTVAANDARNLAWERDCIASELERRAA